VSYDSEITPVAVSPNLTPNIVQAKEYLNAKHWPPGYTNFLLNNTKSTPYRFFVCDDSGSMASNDGKRIIPNTGKTVSCTRWTEMVESLKFHSSLAQAIDMPCEFRMLNSSAPVTIGGPTSPPNAYASFQDLLAGSPGMHVLVMMSDMHSYI
jgi:hypothetical protein